MLTKDDIITLSDEDYESQTHYEKKWLPGGGYGYRKGFDYDKNIFRELEKEFPNSGVKEFFTKLENIEIENFVAYMSDHSGEFLNIKRVFNYYRVYAKYPQIKFIQMSQCYFILNEALGINYWYPRRINEDFIKRNFKSGNDFTSVTGIPSYAIDIFKRTKSMNEWDALRVLFKKYIKSEDDGKNLIKFCDKHSWDVTSTLKRIKNVLSTGYYSLGTLLAYTDDVISRQGIPLFDALDYIKNYISNCKRAGIIPDLNTDSLLFFNAVAARLTYQNESTFATLQTSTSAKHFNYSGCNYYFRVPETQDEVMAVLRKLRCADKFFSGNNIDSTIAISIMYKREEDIPVAVLSVTQRNPEIKAILTKYDTSEICEDDGIAELEDYKEYLKGFCSEETEETEELPF